MGKLITNGLITNYELLNSLLVIVLLSYFKRFN